MTNSAVDLRSLWEACLACLRRKRGTRDCLRYGGRLLDRLAAARVALEAGTWRPSRTRVFVTTRPKAREIHAPVFADRVVHHWLVPQLEALYEPIFIHDSYANRLGKGTHAAVSRLQRFMRQASCNGERRAYAMQLDIGNCFNSIDRRRLFGMVLQRLEKAARRQPRETERYRLLARVTRQLLTGNPGHGAYRLGHPARFDRVPAHKRLVNAAPECGLAIGNLSSQFFANVYLNELDQFVKHTLKCRRYLRYVDDFVLIDPDPEQLLAWRDAIASFLDRALGLRLRNTEVVPVPVSRGVDFLGYVVRPAYLLPRRRVVTSARASVERWHARIAGRRGLTLDGPERAGLIGSLGSYLGHFSHASGFRAAARLWVRNPWLNGLCRLEWPRAVSRMEPPWSTSLAGQHSWFSAQFPGSVVWLQVGASWECFDEDAVAMSKQFRLRLAVHPRPGFDATLSVPERAWFKIRSVLAKHDVAAVSAEQCGRVRRHRHGLRRRALSWISPSAVAG